MSDDSATVMSLKEQFRSAIRLEQVYDLTATQMLLDLVGEYLRHAVTRLKADMVREGHEMLTQFVEKAGGELIGSLENYQKAVALLDKVNQPLDVSHLRTRAKVIH